MSKHRLDTFQRLGIHRLFLDGHSAEEIFDRFFGCDSSQVSLKYLRDRLLFFSTESYENIANYLVGTDKVGGRKRKFDVGDDIMIKVAIFSQHATTVGHFVRICRVERNSNNRDIYEFNL